MKIRMNLLPYRAARRKDARNRFWASFAGVVGLSAIGAAAVHLGIAGYVAAQDERNAYIRQQNQQLDVKIKEIAALRENIEAVKAQQDIIAKLQSDRSAPTHLFDQMVRLVPDGMYLTALKQEGVNVTVTGLSQSSDLVSSFMVGLQRSEHLMRPELVEIKALASKDLRRYQQFTLKFALRRTAAGDKAGTGAAPAAARPLSGIGAPAAVPAAAVPSASAVVPGTGASAPAPSGTASAAMPAAAPASGASSAAARN